jgi:thymidylate kinase
MFLVIEGIHDVGKSTLANSLQPPFALFSNKRLFPELISAKVAHVSDFAFASNCAISWFAQYISGSINVLFDRLHLSEYAYGMRFKRIDKDTAIKRFKMVDDKLSHYDVGLIYLNCNYTTMLQRKKDKNDVYNEEDHDELTLLFDEAYAQTKIKSLRINTELCDINTMITMTKVFILNEFGVDI